VTSLEQSLDQWCELLLESGEQAESRPGGRRFGPAENPTVVAAVAELSPAVNLLFSTVIDPGVAEDSGVRQWCSALNADAGLNRFVAYPGGDVTVETRLVLPLEAAASPAAVYLVVTAVSHQHLIRNLFAHGGPAAVAEALRPGLSPFGLADAPLPGGEEWTERLRTTAGDRLAGVEPLAARLTGGLFRCAPDGADGPALTVDVGAVAHPTYGPALDRTMVVDSPPLPEHAEIVAALNRSRSPVFAGAGAWSVSGDGRVMHRLTVPLAILDAARGLAPEIDESEWLTAWLFDTVDAESGLAAPFLLDPLGSLAAQREADARAIATHQAGSEGA
jgi:hypothetical protein